MNKINLFVAAVVIVLIGYFILIPEENVFSDSDETFQLTVEVLQTESYCDGAPPQREMFLNEDGTQNVNNQMEELTTPKPVPGKVLHIKEGSTNNLDKSSLQTLTTDDNGVFTADLTVGTYCIIEDQKQSLPNPDEYAPSDMYGVDMQCLEDNWNRCDKVIEITSSTSTQITYHEDCFWEKDCTFCEGTNGPCPIPQ